MFDPRAAFAIFALIGSAVEAAQTIPSSSGAFTWTCPDRATAEAAYVAYCVSELAHRFQ